MTPALNLRRDSARRLPPRLALLALLLGFAAFKLPYLDLPYYWDEAWVYAPAVKAMRMSGISLMPWAIPPELSRGHPLAFHTLGAAWMSVFGESFTAMHALPLCITLLLLIATYRLASLFGGEWLGLSAAVLVAANELVLAQSGLLLPETLLALAMVSATIGYLRRKAWLYVAAGVLALWTKETALVLVLALLGAHAAGLAAGSAWPSRRAWIRWLLVLLAPVAIASAFFLVQRWKLGWFLFPEHVEMITWSRKEIAYKAREAFAFAFEAQGAQWLTLGGAVIAPVLLLRHRPWHAAGSAIGFITAIKVLWGRWAVPAAAQLPVVMACLALGVWLLHRLARSREQALAEPLLALSLACVGLWAFSALNFYTPRYLLPILPFLAAGAVLAWRATALARRAWAIPAAAGLVAANMLLSIGRDGHVGDARLSYRDAIRVHQERIAFCVREGLQQEPMLVSFSDLHYMTHPEAGYLQATDVFTRCSTERSAATRFAFVDYQSRKELPEELIAQGFRRTATFRHGWAWGDVYARQPAPEPH